MKLIFPLIAVSAIFLSSSPSAQGVTLAEFGQPDALAPPEFSEDNSEEIEDAALFDDDNEEGESFLQMNKIKDFIRRRRNKRGGGGSDDIEMSSSRLAGGYSADSEGSDASEFDVQSENDSGSEDEENSSMMRRRGAMRKRRGSKRSRSTAD